MGRDTTSCVLELPESNVNASDIVRVVYACHDDERGPATFKWTKEPERKVIKDGNIEVPDPSVKQSKVTTHQITNKRGERMTLSACQKGDKLEITSVLVEGRETNDVDYFPMYSKGKLMEE